MYFSRSCVQPKSKAFFLVEFFFFKTEYLFSTRSVQYLHFVIRKLEMYPAIITFHFSIICLFRSLCLMQLIFRGWANLCQILNNWVLR